MLWPGEERCKTLKEIKDSISKLNSPQVSQVDKNTAIKGIQIAMKILKCE